MANINGHIHGLCHRLLKYPRLWYHKHKSKRLVNHDFSLFCNNCTGGVILHDLGLRFNSPTINLNIQPREFINFVNNLRDYMRCELEEIHDASVDFPVGRLSLPKDGVTFMLNSYTTALLNVLRRNGRSVKTELTGTTFLFC